MQPRAHRTRRINRTALAGALGVALLLSGCSRDPIEELADDLASELVSPSASEDPDPSPSPSPSDDPGSPPPAGGSATFDLTLAGSGQPGDGDTSGTGTATVTFDDDRVCYLVEVQVDSEVTALHLHEGPPDAEGEVLVNLDAPVGGSIDSCTVVGADVVSAVLADPAGHYLNVHTRDFPNGAIRAQFG